MVKYQLYLKLIFFIVVKDLLKFIFSFLVYPRFLGQGVILRPELDPTSTPSAKNRVSRASFGKETGGS